MTVENDEQGGIFRPGDVVDQYKIEAFLGQGGSGEVYRGTVARSKAQYALKVFVPYHYLREWAETITRSELTEEILSLTDQLAGARHEFSTLSVLDHPNIVKVYGDGTSALTAELRERLTSKLVSYLRLRPSGAKVSTPSLPFFVCGYVEGFPLSKTENAAEMSRTQILETVLAIASALDYLHFERGMMHCDVKSANVLIRAVDGLPVLVDFALARPFDDENDAADVEDFRFGFDSSLAPHELVLALRRTIRAGSTRKEVREEFFPHLDRYQYGKLLRSLLPTWKYNLREDESAYLEVVADQLTRLPWLRANPSRRLRDLIDRVEAPRYYGLFRVPSTEEDLVIPGLGGEELRIPPPFRHIATHPGVTRLNRIFQLSLLPTRFVAATHTRYYHALDAFVLAVRLARRLVSRPSFRSVFDNDDVDLLLVTALLHDINHIPLMHVIQELGDTEVGEQLRLFEWAFEVRDSAHGETLEGRLDSLGLEPARILEILDRKWQYLASPVDQAVKSIIDSGADIDKMSYLRLDGYLSGLGFASGVRWERLTALSDVAELPSGVIDPDSRGLHLVFEEEALRDLEGLVEARRVAFESLYWCPENRAMMAAVLERLRKISLTPNGISAIVAVFRASLAEPDYSVLRRIDALAREVGVGGLEVASFFDNFGEGFVVAYDSSGVAAAFKNLDRAGRSRIVAGLRAALAREVDIDPEDVPVVLDVPLRDLTIGGPLVLRRANGTLTPAAEVSAAIKIHEQALSQLSATARVYCDARTLQRLEDRLGAGRVRPFIGEVLHGQLTSDVR